MSPSLAVFVFITLWDIVALLPVKQVTVQAPLTRAVIEQIRNIVELIPQNDIARPAGISDAINPGDTLATSRASQAELRFNDGSVARIGEQSVFQFLGDRTLRLSNGSMLLLIPPGRGKTPVRTPNATCEIKGSALFARYLPPTDTTICDSSDIVEVCNRDASQCQKFRAGECAAIVQDTIEPCSKEMIVAAKK